MAGALGLGFRLAGRRTTRQTSPRRTPTPARGLPTMTRPGRRAAWIAAGLIATAFAFASTPAEVSAADSPSEAGWTSLFDGKTLSGWEALTLPRQPTSKWEVVDGLLVGSGGASMIFSPRG